MPESTVRAPPLNDAVALTAQAVLAPWNLAPLGRTAFLGVHDVHAHRDVPADDLAKSDRHRFSARRPAAATPPARAVVAARFRVALAVGWPEKRRALAVAAHTLLAFGFALFARPCLVLSQAIHDGNMALLRELVDSELGPAVLRNLWVSQTFDFLLSYCFGLALLIGAVTYHELKHEKLRTAKLQCDWMQARLQALRMQLNPHFLFNTLNTAVAVLRREPATAEKMLVGLSELLRRILREGETEQATLETRRPSCASIWKSSACASATGWLSTSTCRRKQSARWSPDSFYSHLPRTRWLMAWRTKTIRCASTCERGARRSG